MKGKVIIMPEKQKKCCHEHKEDQRLIKDNLWLRDDILFFANGILGFALLILCGISSYNQEYVIPPEFIWVYDAVNPVYTIQISHKDWVKLEKYKKMIHGGAFVIVWVVMFVIIGVLQTVTKGQFVITSDLWHILVMVLATYGGRKIFKRIILPKK